MARSQVDGRPTKLTQTLRKDDVGKPVTVADEIVERMRGGAGTIDVAQAVGIARSTLNAWLQEGARHAARRVSGEQLTKRERDLADFSDREAQAVAEWKVAAEQTLEGQSVPRRHIVVTEKQVGGVLTERTIRTENLEPDAKVVMWRLERRFPQQYGRQLVEVSGPNGGPIPVDVRAELRIRVEEMVDRLAANVVEALPPGDDA